jgi:small-conductance mechanosensitive channel
MLVPFIIVVVIAAGLLVLLLMARQRSTQLTTERDEANRRLEETTGELTSTRQRLTSTEERLATTESERDGLSKEVAELTDRTVGLCTQLDETSDALRKRTELADAQAMQIDALSAARDELQQQLTSAEERIVTLAARPGVVVGESADDPNAETLWDLELARSERSWRNSVAINPVDDASPFETTDDPLRTAVEVEAAALREDVGALITIDWKAEPIPSASRRLLVVRVAQEMLALAARAPGAARLVVTDAGDGSGELTMAFEAADDSGPVINLIPPAISDDLIEVGDEGLSVTVRPAV